MAILAATPPLTTRVGVLILYSDLKRSMERAQRSAMISATVCWNACERSAISLRFKSPAGSFSTDCRTAVFKPENEKSSSLRPFIGVGSGKRFNAAAGSLHCAAIF